MSRSVSRFALLLAAALGGWSPAALAAEETKQPLSVLYVGGAKSPRAAAFEKLLQRHFSAVKVADRATFDPAAAKDADVVVFDWSQGDSRLESTELPFGRLEDWGKPTVLLNHSGLLVARRWQVIGGVG
jgi:hypothetical protein